MTTNTHIAAHPLTDEIMALAHRWAQATYLKALGRPYDDFDIIKRDMRAKLSALEAAELGEGARIWIDQSETSSIQVVGKLLRHIPDEFWVTAERDNEDDDWYIRVTNSGGYKDYDGYWRSSARKTADEVMLEAARGAMVPLASTPPPVPALDVQGERIERLEGCRRALEIIAVGDAQSPQVQAAEELIALGFWRDIPQARSAPPPLALVAPLSEEQHAQIYERLHRVGGELNFVSPIAYGKEVERAHGIVTKESTRG